MWYNKEKAILLGETYYDLLKLLNGAEHDPYDGTSMVFPLRCLTQLFPRATALGKSEKLEENMAKLMNAIDPGEMKALMNTPMPMEYRTWFDYGMMKHAERRKDD